jgi:hypothetical protein
MDNVKYFIKKIGMMPKTKVAEVFVNNDKASQIIDLITRRFKEIGRVEEGQEVTKKISRVFFPCPEDLDDPVGSKCFPPTEVPRSIKSKKNSCMSF